MDYSKKDGGTRVHDAMKARTLATGIGSSLSAMREHGSHRAARVIEGIKPGQLVHSRSLEPHVKHRDAMAQEHARQRLEEPLTSPSRVVNNFPMTSGSCSQEECGVAQPKAGFKNTSNDQGEQTRVPTTGRVRKPKVPKVQIEGTAN